jgi:transcriptional regulator with XRE-family HTH domain
MDETVSSMEPKGSEVAKGERGGAPDLGARITRLRRARRWSRSMLAEKLGVSRDRVSKWERGENVPPLKVLLAMSGVLGLSLDELVKGEPAADLGWDVEEWNELARGLVGLVALLRRLGILEDDEVEDWR